MRFDWPRNHLWLYVALLGLILSAGAQLYGSAALSPEIQEITDPKAGTISSSSFCQPLSVPSNRTVEVNTEQELWNAVNENVPNTTILVADGVYHLGRYGYYLWFDTPNVTLRSKSGNRAAVVLDDEYAGSEVITVLASNVTIADISILRARTHAIHVTSSDSGDTLNTLIYNVHILDPGQQGIKINPHAAKIYFPDNGVIACSQIELSDSGRTKVWEFNDSCYTGGVDAHQSRGWEIRDNRITGFWCQQGLSEHAIHLWTGSRDPLIERNILVDNARGVGLGLQADGAGRTYADDPCPSADGYVDHYGGIVRNNFIFASRADLFASQSGFDCGICLAQACGAQVLHNTVVSTQAPFSSIEWRFSNTQAEIINNLVSHNLRERDGATAGLAGNLPNAPLSLFENILEFQTDLHLVAGADLAIDQGISLPAGLCDQDIDGDPRPLGAARDIGADEYGSPQPSAVSDLHITSAVTTTLELSAVLQWTPPPDALTTTLRYSGNLISEANWDEASLLIGDLPGNTGIYTASVPYTGDVLYFALKTQNADGQWSSLSNNAFWPRWDVRLPVLFR